MPCNCGADKRNKAQVAEAAPVETKPTNPKDAIGSNKLPLHLWPETATVFGALGLLDGMLKYGRSNYRAIGVRATIYVDACKRHLNAWLEGEECADDSSVPHLGHALACIAILVDAQAAGKLNDDRLIRGGYKELVERWTPLVAEIKERHKDKDPKHYTIADNRDLAQTTFDVPEMTYAEAIAEVCHCESCSLARSGQ